MFFFYFQDFTKLIDGYTDILRELRLLRESVPLNMISLRLTDINQALINTVLSVRQAVVDHFVLENRTKCREYETIFIFYNYKHIFVVIILLLYSIVRIVGTASYPLLVY